MNSSTLRTNICNTWVGDLSLFPNRAYANLTAPVWSQGCTSWYKNGTADGKVTALWPGSTLHYLEALDAPRYEDWDIERYGNRFDYLGNGHSSAETRTLDVAYYIKNADDSPLDPCLKAPGKAAP
jgi:cyclohexanone monooxygenase